MTLGFTPPPSPLGYGCPADLGLLVVPWDAVELAGNGGSSELALVPSFFFSTLFSNLCSCNTIVASRIADHDFY
jgi:hypothetical protein